MKSITQVMQNLVKPYIDNKDKAYAANIAPVEVSPAEADHTAGTQLIYNGVLCDVTADIAINDDLATEGAGANISAASKVTEQLATISGNLTTETTNRQNADNNISDVIGRNGAKNLLPNNATPQELNGITFTVNSDGTVTVSGTATATTEITIAEFYLDARSYKFSGTPSGGSSSTYFMYHNEQSVGGIQTDVGSGATFTAQNAAHKQYLKIQIANGYAITGTLVFKPMLTLASQPDSDYAHYEPYSKTNQQLTDDAQKALDEIEARAALGAHNLITFPYGRASGYTNNGYTYAYDSDGVVTINGTMESGKTSSYFEFTGSGAAPIPISIKPNTKYKLSGGVSNTVMVKIEFTGGSTYTDSGNGVEFTTPSSLSTYKIYIHVQAASLTNQKIYPMLRLATDADDTYQPYAKTNQQLTQETTGLIDNAFANGAVNLLPNAKSDVVEGVQYVVNADGTIIVSRSTASSNPSTFVVIQDFALKAGKYKLSGCPSDGGQESMRFQAYSETISGWLAFDVGNGAEFTLNTDVSDLRISIRIAATESPSNKVFKPMITLADQPNSDYAHYVPYAKTNRELTLADVGTYNVPVIMGKEQSSYVRGAIIYGDKAAKHTVTINSVKQFADSTDYTSQFDVDYSNAGYAVIYSATTALAGALMNVNVTVS